MSRIPTAESKSRPMASQEIKLAQAAMAQWPICGTASTTAMAVLPIGAGHQRSVLRRGPEYTTREGTGFPRFRILPTAHSAQLAEQGLRRRVPLRLDHEVCGVAHCDVRN